MLNILEIFLQNGLKYWSSRKGIKTHFLCSDVYELIPSGSLWQYYETLLVLVPQRTPKFLSVSSKFTDKNPKRLTSFLTLLLSIWNTGDIYLYLKARTPTISLRAGVTTEEQIPKGHDAWNWSVWGSADTRHWLSSGGSPGDCSWWPRNRNAHRKRKPWAYVFSYEKGSNKTTAPFNPVIVTSQNIFWDVKCHKFPIQHLYWK